MNADYRPPIERRPEVLAEMPAEVVIALREYFVRQREKRPQTDDTRAAMALYQKTRRRLVPGVAERNRAATRRCRENWTPERKEEERVRHNARQRARYRESRGGVVRSYTRRTLQ